MDTVQLSTQIRRLIAEGELETAARTLLQYLDQEGLSSADKARFQVYNQALYQVAQLNELQDQVIRGIISTEDADLKRNRIREALLEISEGLERLDLAHLSAQAVVPLSEDSLGKKRRIALILILGIPLSIMMIMLIFGFTTFTRFLNFLFSTQGSSLEQPGQLPSTPEETFTGCYIETGMMTKLLQRPIMMGADIMELPEYKKYQVLDTKKQIFAGQTVYFFKIQEGEYTGWVRQIQLEFTSPACLE